MTIKPIKTRKFLPPRDDLEDLISGSIKKIPENSIVVITSKVVSISEGRCIPQTDVQDKDQLVMREAEKYLPREFVPGGWAMHTIKNNLFIPTAGVDESNALDFYILWPKDPKESAKKIWQMLRKKFGVKNLGVLITDSHSIPMRRGLVGMALSFWGFMPLRDYRGKADIFGKELHVSQTNIPDSLAAASVFAMGEGNEQTPIAVISDLGNRVKFIQKEYKDSKDFNSFDVPLKEDLFRPFIESVPWRKGGGGKT